MGKVIKSVTKSIGGALGLGKKYKVQANTEDLEKEKADTAKQRVRLYGTEGLEVGEEVLSVGRAKRRNIFGN